MCPPLTQCRVASLRLVNARDRAWPWGGGVLAAVAALGPALRPGSLLSLDLVLLPTIPVPPGVWGLGPELPRRVPYGVVLAWASSVVTGPFAGKALIVVSIAAAVAGAMRLTDAAPPAARAGAGLLYGLSPFLLTRIGAGHLGIVASVAVLPWALPVLLRPADRLGATYLWALAMGLTGVAGGTLALALVAVGLVADRSVASAAKAAAVVVLAQLPWLVPGVIVAATGVSLVDSGPFATHASGLAGWFGLAGGHGFWRESSQVGGDASVGVALLGGAVLALAAAGARRLPAAWRARAGAAAAVGAALTLATTVPAVRGLYAAFSRTPFGAPARESQRWLVLLLVVLAPAAAHGAARIGGKLVLFAPAAIALALAAPGLWGIGGRLEPVDLPPAWSRIASEVHRRPGTVLGLPWHQYLDIRAAEGRRVLNPLPDRLGGDVLISSDPELGSARRREDADRREAAVLPLLDRIESGDAVAGDLARLGVRWVVLLREVDWRRYRALDDDGGLRRVLSDGDAALYEVRAWKGAVVTDDGRPLRPHAIVQPLQRLPASDAATWSRSGAPGWRRGWSEARVTSSGTIALPPGGGWVWYAPGVLVFLAYVWTLSGAWVARRALRTRQSAVPSIESD
jgi:hypothetical protein